MSGLADELAFQLRKEDGVKLQSLRLVNGHHAHIGRSGIGDAFGTDEANEIIRTRHALNDILATSGDRDGTAKTLVLVTLYGGNDGLNTVVPYGDPAYYRARPKLGIPEREVLKAAAQYIQTDKFAVVVVGDLAKIEKPIRDANLGPVRVVTADEILK